MKTMRFMFVAMTLFTNNAKAESLYIHEFQPNWNLTQAPFAIMLSGVEIFRLEPGGCLIGPVVFRLGGSEDAFRLSAGSRYPEGCGTQRKTP